MNKKKVYRMLTVGCFLLLCLAVVVIGCAEPAPPPTAPKHLKIGVIEPITGFPVGIAWVRGFELFFGQLNEQGGVKIGQEQYLIDLIVEDSRFDPEGAASAAKKLVYKDEVKFVFGAILDQEAQAIYEVCAPNNVLHIASWINVPGCAGDVSPNKPLCVRLNISLDAAHPADYDCLVENYPNVKTIVITAPPFGLAPMIERCIPIAEEHGVEVLGVEIFSASMYEFAEFIPLDTRLLALYEPDAVHTLCSGLAANELKSLRELGFKGPVISCAPLGADVIIAVAGPVAATDVICNGMDPGHPTDAMQEVMEKWQAKYGEEFVSDALMAYDNAWVLIQAMEKAQSVDPEKVTATLETMTEPGSLQTTFGPAHMGGLKRFGVNRVLVRPVPIVTIMDGKVDVVKFYLPEE